MFVNLSQPNRTKWKENYATKCTCFKLHLDRVHRWPVCSFGKCADCAVDNGVGSHQNPHSIQRRVHFEHIDLDIGCAHTIRVNNLETCVCVCACVRNSLFVWSFGGLSGLFWKYRWTCVRACAPAMHGHIHSSSQIIRPVNLHKLICTLLTMFAFKMFNPRNR